MSPYEQVSGIKKLESYDGDIDIDEVVLHYRQNRARPLWQLAEDMQWQAMAWSNVVERLKAGDKAADIRERFGDKQEDKDGNENLQLLPEEQLPNPHERRLLDRAREKLSRYRKAMVEFIQRYGGEFLQELSIETGFTVNLGVQLGFPPAIVLAVEHTYGIGTQMRWGGQGPSQ